MKILLNGEVQQVAPSCMLAEVFQHLRIDLATHCAVAVNAKVIPRDKFAHTPLHEGDNYWLSILLLVDKHCYALIKHTLVFLFITQ